MKDKDRMMFKNTSLVFTIFNKFKKGEKNIKNK
jgi:hypothetical protein